MNKKRMEKF